MSRSSSRSVSASRRPLRRLLRAVLLAALVLAGVAPGAARSDSSACADDAGGRDAQTSAACTPRAPLRDMNAADPLSRAGLAHRPGFAKSLVGNI